jgi:hypothetical protein
MDETTQRTDPHRPSAIVPQDYEEVLWYDCGGSQEPSVGVNCMKPMFHFGTGSIIEGSPEHSHIGCCVLGIKVLGGKWAETGREHGAGKCTICGSFFRYGSVWQHLPTGDYVHLGHDCADKYGLVANITTRKEWAAYRKTMEKKRSEAAKEMKLARRRDFFIKEHKLETVFEVREEHDILRDMYNRLHQWGSLSEKQIAFARKLEDEVRNPKPKVEEVKVQAPIEDARQTFTGTIVSAKLYDSQYGVSTKITVKMETPDGIWLSWGTCPSAVDSDNLRGSKITITARLRQGDDPHFTFFSRPSLVDFVPPPAAE